MVDLRTVAFRALDGLRSSDDESTAVAGVGRTELEATAALADRFTASTRLVLSAPASSPDYELFLEGLRLGAKASGSEVAALLRAIGGNAEFRAALVSSSECRVDTPFAPIRQIIQADGRLRYCCTHKSGPHCYP
jgi:hypothetical protein